MSTFSPRPTPSSNPCLAQWLIALALLHGLLPQASVASTVWTQSGPEGGDITELISHPSMSDLLYAAANGGGVFRTIDGANTWEAASTDLTDRSVQCLALDPATPSTLYTGTLGGSVFRSVDGAVSWTEISTGLPGGSVQSLAVDPGSGTVLVGLSGGVYRLGMDDVWAWSSSGLTSGFVVDVTFDALAAGVVYAGTGSAGLFKSSDSGLTWTARNNGLTSTFVQAIASHPSTAGTVFAGTPSAGVFRSLNSGASWTQVNSGLLASSVNALHFDSSAATLFAGTESGVVSSTNNGAFWSVSGSGLSTFVRSLTVSSSARGATDTVMAGLAGRGVAKRALPQSVWQIANQGLLATSVRALATASDTNAHLFAGTNGAGVFVADIDGSWQSASLGLGSLLVSDVLVDDSAAQLVYAATSGEGVWRSSNDGASWQLRSNGLPDLVRVLASPAGLPDRLHAGTNAGIYRTTDAGGSWSATGLAAEDVRAVAIHPSNPAIVFAGTFASGVFKSVNSGTSWTPASTGLASNFVWSLVFDPAAPETLYAGTDSGGVFRTINSGDSWTPQGLTEHPVTTVKMAAGDLLAGTLGGGVWRSRDGGLQWNPINDGLSALSVYDLEHDNDHSSGPLWHAATFGGGIFEAEVFTELIFADGFESGDTVAW